MAKWVVRRLRRREKSTKPYHLEEGDVVNLQKDHCRTLEIERPENDETSLSAGFLLCLPIPWLCVHPCPRLQFWLDRTHSFRISPNPSTKSVKENATKQPAFANLETVFVRKQCCNVKSKTTLGNGYLGSRIDEEHSKMRYLVRSGPRGIDDPKSSMRPQVRRDHPLSLSGGIETNKDSLSNGERTGKSPA
ncbi:LOW QUALITY PROTEIN: hypothetical protein YC2023_108487 [Brassica napus]